MRAESRPGREPRPRRSAAGVEAALLFQGEEWGEQAPFRFFTDHIDPIVADATREGRHREFVGFAGFDGDVPDPQALESFEASCLSPAEPEDLYVVRTLERAP